MKKILSSIICIVIIMAMSSCGGGISSKQLTEGETIDGDSLNQLTDEEHLSDNGGDAFNQLTDREILVKIYEATNGPEWSEHLRENWLTDKPIGEWSRVKTNDDGRVIELELHGRGLLPAEIGGLSELENLNIQMKKSGADNVIPAQIGRLTKLKYLWISAETDLIYDNTILPNISMLKNLEELTILGLGGAIPENIGQLRKLRKLFLWRFEGKIPESICELTNLEELRLIAFSQPVGAVPECIGRLSKLKLLEIGYDKWKEEINQPNSKFPESVWDLTNLETLNMRSLSNTGGPIPGDKVAKMKNLQEIKITKCGITGPIPAELFASNKMSTMVFSENKLTGNIPTEIGDCRNLRYLNLSDNQLSGNIPEELANCKKLVGCILYGNQLSPDIPPALKNHPKFSEFQFRTYP